ncbi:MAG: class E sortase [Oscillospiraceae bacterium]
MSDRFLTVLSILLVSWAILAGCARVGTPSSKPALSEALSEPPVSSSQEMPPASSIQPEPTVYPTDRMFVTQERIDYRNSAMVLEVPRLALNADVVGEFSEQTRSKLLDGTLSSKDLATFFASSDTAPQMDQSVLLLNNSPLPGTGANANVTLMAHRDIFGKEFYHIDTMTTGDRIYLRYCGMEYVYEYIATEIRPGDDWSLTYCHDEPMVSLVSCDPIGTNRNRIVVTARLIECSPLDFAAI